MKNTPEKRVLTVSVLIGSTRIMPLKDVDGLFKNAEILNVRTRRYGANRKSLQGKAIANDVNFEAATLRLRRKQTNVVQDLWLEHIEAATTTAPEVGYPLNVREIDWNNSAVEIAETVALDAGAVIELTFTYIEYE